MGHRIDAVKWWNRVGCKCGAQHPKVRAFMDRASNDELQLAGENRLNGASLGRITGYRDPMPRRVGVVDRISGRRKRAIDVKLGAAADLMEAEKYQEADVELCGAYGLIPEPRLEWDIAFIVLMSRVEVQRLLGDMGVALELLHQASECVYAESSALHVMRGKIAFDRGERERAASEFLFALLEGGREVFELEEPKYYVFACEVIRPPAGCESWDDYESSDDESEA